MQGLQLLPSRMRKLARGSTGSTLITQKFLRSWKLPAVQSSDSKEDRGRVLVIGGEREIPGAVLLAGLAAMRSGAGKLQIATCESAAVQLGVAVPEARVIGLKETDAGAIKGSNAVHLSEIMNQSQATLVGPGMTNENETFILLEQLLSAATESTLVLDAGALSSLAGDSALLPTSKVHAIVTPHAGEMAKLVEVAVEDIERDPLGVADNAARTLGVVVVLKGPETHIVSPDGEYYRYKCGDVGLATSGSGDILAGIITGLAARGASPLQAAVWGVYLHGEAGNALVKKSGRVGYLARELLCEVPPLLNRLSGSSD